MLDNDRERNTNVDGYNIVFRLYDQVWTLNIFCCISLRLYIILENIEFFDVEYLRTVLK